MMLLDKLSLDDLSLLSAGLDTLVAAGNVLEAHGFNAVFDLTPGHDIKILTGLKMPVVGPASTPWLDAALRTAFPELTESGPRQNEGADGLTGPVDPIPGVSSSLAGDGPLVDAECAALGASLSGVPEISAEAVPAVGGTEQIGVGASVAPVPAEIAAGGGHAVPSPGGDLKTGPLSAEERAEIVKLDGEGWTRANIAAFLCRKVQTVALYLTSLMRPEDFVAASACLKLPDTAPCPEQPIGPAAVGGKAGCDGAQEVAAPAPVALKTAPKPTLPKPTLPKPTLPEPTLPERALQLETATDGLRAHLLSLSRKGGWTLDKDAELMRLACLGWAHNEIELDLDVSGAKARFELLTDSRSYPREKVSAALAAMLAAAEAAAKATAKTAAA